MAHPSAPGWLISLLGLTALGLFLLNFSVYLDRLLSPAPQELIIDIERRVAPLSTPEPPTTRFHLRIYPEPPFTSDRSPRRFEFRRLPHHPDHPQVYSWKHKHIGRRGIHPSLRRLPLDEHDAQTFVLLDGGTIAPQP